MRYRTCSVTRVAALFAALPLLYARDRVVQDSRCSLVIQYAHFGLPELVGGPSGSGPPPFAPED